MLSFLVESNPGPVSNQGKTRSALQKTAPNPAIPSCFTRVNRPESALNHDLSATSNGHPVGPEENTSDPVALRIPDSPRLGPFSMDSPILPTRQKTTVEKTTGYDSCVLRRERGEAEPARATCGFPSTFSLHGSE